MVTGATFNTSYPFGFSGESAVTSPSSFIVDATVSYARLWEPKRPAWNVCCFVVSRDSAGRRLSFHDNRDILG
jgi:hypothetical protein